MKDMKGIGLWLNDQYNGGVGSSSKYILSRCLGCKEEELSRSLPSDGEDLGRCFELYKNSKFIQKRISFIFKDKIFGIYPVYKHLFQDLYKKFIDTDNIENTEIKAILYPSFQIMIKYLKKNKIEFSFIENELVYIVDNIKYIYTVGYSKSINLIKEREKQKRLDGLLNFIRNLNKDNLTYKDIIEYHELQKGLSIYDNKEYQEFHNLLLKHPDWKDWCVRARKEKII